MILIEERIIGQEPAIQLSLKLKMVGDDKPRWFVFLKDEQIGWYDDYNDAKDRLRLLESLSEAILTQYFDHNECDRCDTFGKNVIKTYTHVTQKSDDSNAGTWTIGLCQECHSIQKEDKDTVSIVEVSA